MASPIKNVLLVGVSPITNDIFFRSIVNSREIQASGNVGPPIVSAFLNSKKFNVTVLSRTESTKTVPGNAKVIKSDLTPASLETSFKGQDAIISLVGNAGFAGQKALIDAAVAAGVKRFIPSEFGSNTESSVVRQRVPIFQGKRDIIEYAQTKESSGLSWTGFITGPIFDLVRAFLGTRHSVGSLLTLREVPENWLPQFQHRRKDGQDLGRRRRAI